jgi:cation transport protein ChaC
MPEAPIPENGEMREDAERIPAAADACDAEPMPPDIAWLRSSSAPVWIFAYGSLMWNPEIACAETRPALLYGYHRNFCLYSYDYRGTRERPGLVLGLDRGGACWGMAMRLDDSALAASLDHLWAREMSGGGVYAMRRVTVRAGDATLSAHAFVIRRDHPDYAGPLALDAKAQLILGAAGCRGSCRDYFATTLGHLERFGRVDRPLRRLAERIAALERRR